MENKIVEILQYTLRKGTGVEFHNIMAEISVPLHNLHGIDVVSYGNSLHDPDCYCLIRSFENEESMSSVLAAFYASSGWINGPREEIISRIENSLKTILNMPQKGIDGLRKS